MLLGRHDEKRLGGALLLHIVSEAAGSASPSVYRVRVMGHEVPASRTLLVLELNLSFGGVEIIELGSSGFMLFLRGLLFTH